MGSLPLGVVSLTGSHPNFIFCYVRKLLFFAVSSMLIKATLGIKILLPILILGMVPHFICAYAVPRLIRKSLAVSIGVSTSESLTFSWLLICLLNLLTIDCYFALVFVSPRNRDSYHIVKFHKNIVNWLSSFLFVIPEPARRDYYRSAIPHPDQSFL